MRDTVNTNKTKTGVLLVNLGTPDLPNISSIRRYLREFLSDNRVINLPKILQQALLNFVILPFRPRKSIKEYKSVWTDKGSPLLVISKQQRDAIDDFFSKNIAKNIVVELAMRYGNPSLESVIDKLYKQNIDSLLVLPLYPQYSNSTSASTYEKIAQILCKYSYIPEYKFINCYYNDNRYIAALANSILKFRDKHGTADKLLISFHGLPEASINAGDPYLSQCQATAKLIADKLNLTNNDYQVSFQSRLGKAQWIKPYTDKVLAGFGKQGISSVQVICPGFSADCLETLAEIAIYNKNIFLAAGGSKYQYIPCLNTNTKHIDFLANLILERIK